MDVNTMNNYHDQSENQPRECPECFSAMTEHLTDLLECDQCPHIEFKGESNE